MSWPFLQTGFKRYKYIAESLLYCRSSLTDQSALNQFAESSKSHISWKTEAIYDSVQEYASRKHCSTIRNRGNNFFWEWVRSDLQHSHLIDKCFRCSPLCKVWNTSIQLNNRKVCIEGGWVHQWPDMEAEVDGPSGICPKQKYSTRRDPAHYGTGNRPYSPHNDSRIVAILLYWLRRSQWHDS